MKKTVFCLLYYVCRSTMMCVCSMYVSFNVETTQNIPGGKKNPETKGKPIRECMHTARSLATFYPLLIALSAIDYWLFLLPPPAIAILYTRYSLLSKYVHVFLIHEQNIFPPYFLQYLFCLRPFVFSLSFPWYIIYSGVLNSRNSDSGSHSRESLLPPPLPLFPLLRYVPSFLSIWRRGFNTQVFLFPPQSARSRRFAYNMNGYIYTSHPPTCSTYTYVLYFTRLVCLCCCIPLRL